MANKFMAVKMQHFEWDALLAILCDARKGLMDERRRLRLVEEMDEDQREYDMGILGHKAEFCDDIIQRIDKAKKEFNKPKFRLLKPGDIKI